MYDPHKQGIANGTNESSSIGQMSNKLRNAKIVNHATDNNVFSSLKKPVAGGSTNQYLPSNLSMHTSEGMLAEYASSVLNNNT